MPDKESLTVPATVTVDEPLLPLDGDVIATVGGVKSIFTVALVFSSDTPSLAVPGTDWDAPSVATSTGEVQLTVAPVQLKLTRTRLLFQELPLAVGETEALMLNVRAAATIPARGARWLGAGRRCALVSALLETTAGDRRCGTGIARSEPSPKGDETASVAAATTE